MLFRSLIFTLSFYCFFTSINSDDCDTCIRRNLSSLAIPLECQCNDHYYCNETQGACQACAGYYINANKMFQDSKGTVVSILEKLLQRYNATNVYHLLKKFHKLSYKLFNKTKEADELTLRTLNQINSVRVKYFQSKDHLDLVHEKVNQLNVIENLNIIRNLIDEMRNIHLKYKEKLQPLEIHESFLQNAEVHEKMKLLEEAVKYSLMELPKYDWNLQQPSSFYYLEELIMKNGDISEQCEDDYKKTFKRNKSKLNKLKMEIEEIVKLLLSKMSSTVSANTLIDKLNILKKNIHNTTSLAESIVKKRKNYYTQLKEVYENVLKLEKLSKALKRLVEKISLLTHEIEKMKKSLDELEERLERVKNFKLKNQPKVSELLTTAHVLRNSKLIKINVEEYEAQIECLEKRLEEYSDCFKTVIHRTQNLGFGCMKLETVCKISQEC